MYDGERLQLQHVWRSEGSTYYCMCRDMYDGERLQLQHVWRSEGSSYYCMCIHMYDGERLHYTTCVKIGGQLLLLYVYICVWWREVTTTSRVWRSEDSSVESVSSLHLYLGSRDRAQVRGKALYQPSTSSSMRFHGCYPCILLYIHLSCNMFPIS